MGDGSGEGTVEGCTDGAGEGINEAVTLAGSDGEGREGDVIWHDPRSLPTVRSHQNP